MMNIKRTALLAEDAAALVATFRPKGLKGVLPKDYNRPAMMLGCRPRLRYRHGRARRQGEGYPRPRLRIFLLHYYIMCGMERLVE